MSGLRLVQYMALNCPECNQSLTTDETKADESDLNLVHVGITNADPNWYYWDTCNRCGQSRYVKFPRTLYHNTVAPLEIIQALTIKTSKINNRDRGVSMSSEMIHSHGPFTFVFKPYRYWYRNLKEVIYGAEISDFLHKPEMFAGEKEWWTPNPISFALDDLEMIIFRERAPGNIIAPKKFKLVAGVLEKDYPNLFKRIIL